MYKEEILQLNISDKLYSFIQITNIDEVFDDLIKSDNGDEEIEDFIPYWTELWPSAIGLSKFIIDYNQLFENKKIIEIGCGLGLPSIVSAAYSTDILATDLLKDAISFAFKNAKLNGLDLNIKFNILDWRSNDSKQKYDVVLASDVAYEQRYFEDLPNALDRLMHEDGIAVLSEPGRKFTKPFIDILNTKFKIFSYSYPVDWRGVSHEIDIYLMKKKIA
ncbi:MAG: hypothetical protein RLZZ546_116 [Bacteroidota bacterium]|jgi:predicted nicotinamide N-methyase